MRLVLACLSFGLVMLFFGFGQVFFSVRSGFFPGPVVSFSGSSSATPPWGEAQWGAVPYWSVEHYIGGQRRSRAAAGPESASRRVRRQRRDWRRFGGSGLGARTADGVTVFFLFFSFASAFDVKARSG